MRVLIVYASYFGSTRGIAERIGEELRADGLDATVESADRIAEIGGFDAVVVGSAIHGGHWLDAAKAFVDLHRAALASRPVWLFSSGPIGDTAVRAEQPDPAEVPALRRELRPRDHRVFAGAFDRATADFSGLGFIERTVVKRFLPDGDYRDWDAIDAWARQIARELKALLVAV